VVCELVLSRELDERRRGEDWNTAAGFEYDIFLSHNAKDRQRVTRLAERLRDAGLRVWFDAWITKPGDDVYLVCGEANQLFRPLNLSDYGIDGEVEFKDGEGKPSGRKIYVQLKRGSSHLRRRTMEGREIFEVTHQHLESWVSQPVDVYLVVRQTDEARGTPRIRWMNLTRYLKNRRDKQSRLIVFDGEPLDLQAVWRLRDAYFPPPKPEG
jgi:hypothetical protein